MDAARAVVELFEANDTRGGTPSGGASGRAQPRAPDRAAARSSDARLRNWNHRTHRQRRTSPSSRATTGTGASSASPPRRSRKSINRPCVVISLESDDGPRLGAQHRGLSPAQRPDRVRRSLREVRRPLARRGADHQARAHPGTAPPLKRACRASLTADDLVPAVNDREELPAEALTLGLAEELRA